MELQAVTASAAVGITRFIIALFMFGMYLTARRDECTGYWTISAILSGVGSTTPLYGATMGSFSIWFACVTVVSGGVCFWWGLALFFGKKPSVVGWWLIGGIAVTVAILFQVTDAQPPRLLAFAATVIIGASLIIREAWVGDGSPMTVGRALVAGSFVFALVVLMTRAIYFLVIGVPVSPTSDHPVNVVLLYLIPLITSILSSVGALLMYFQRTVDEKEHLARHDDLTRIFNRRALSEAGRRTLAAGQGSTAVLLIDVDHFKSVNDTLGHQAGDRVLTTIADTLSRNCRLTDIIGRHGGEEFCIVCPDTTLDEARVLAGRLLAAVGEIPLPEGLARPLSISIGATAAGAASAWDKMLRHADHALYAAKESGRNRVVTTALPKPEAYG
jgi:diguanylate cyclase (GGDEF)-like protein